MGAIRSQAGNIARQPTKEWDPKCSPTWRDRVASFAKAATGGTGEPFPLSLRKGAPMTAEGFRKLVRRAGEAAKFPFTLHPHMIRHACGYKLANDGKDTRAIQLYMGHRNIQNTVGYTQLSAERFKDFWSD